MSLNISELTPGTIQKDGVSYAPRTLSSLVYMNDGKKLSDVMLDMISDGKRFLMKTVTEQTEVQFDGQRVYSIPAPLEKYDFDKFPLVLALNGVLIDSTNYMINDMQLVFKDTFSSNIKQNDILMYIFHYLDIIVESNGINAEYINGIRYFVDKEEPRHKRVKDVWFDTKLNQVKQFNGEEWEVIVTGGGGTGQGAYTINVSLKNTVAINELTRTVDIGIDSFDKDTDLLFVYINSTYLEVGIDYELNDSLKITKSEGTWDGTEDTQLFNFVVIKNVEKVYEGIHGSQIQNNTVEEHKLSLEVIDKLNKIAAKPYVHPESHPASMILEDPQRRFVNDNILELLNTYESTINKLNDSMTTLNNIINEQEEKIKKHELRISSLESLHEVTVLLTSDNKELLTNDDRSLIVR